MTMKERAGGRRCTGGASAPLPHPLPARASQGEGEAESQADAYFNASGAFGAILKTGAVSNRIIGPIRFLTATSELWDAQAHFRLRRRNVATACPFFTSSVPSCSHHSPAWGGSPDSSGGPGCSGLAPSAPPLSRSMRMSRGSAPLLGPTMPRFSSSSMMRAARV